ncbi:MAG: L-aspartate oxidase [Candidatus Dormibacteraeota bacterium]|nr:L-aspartate oxidase [Candidatus Dormibacteraeota bacterium]
MAALHAARAGTVQLLTRTALSESNSFYAQGGIAAAVGDNDSVESHVADTLAVGRGLCDREAVQVLAEEGPARIRELVELGVRFDRDGGRLALGREAAHSAARIVHAGGDTTGAEIQRGLHQALADAGVATLEGNLVRRLLVEDGHCAGAEVEIDGRAVEHRARAVILAAGGGGSLFSYTTNPPTADGSSAALAYQAGAELMDMEFFQFHPTALRLAGAPSFLISEAVRGEGAILVNDDGRRFMAGFPQAELAPRDVVAREIWAEMKRQRSTCVHLDLRHIPPDRVRTRFPQIYATCLRFGIDITSDLVPVAPAAHYMIGGVRTDTWGATSLPGLYACGEAACCGVHGANRLASNSLLESVVFSRRSAQAAARYVAGEAHVVARVPAVVGAEGAQGNRTAGQPLQGPPLPRTEATASGEELPDLMWRAAGLIRTGEGLAQALVRLGDGSASPQHLSARLMCEAALLRTESRGAHYRLDHPDTSDPWRGHIVLQREAGARFERL